MISPRTSMLAGLGLTLALCLPYGETNRLTAENKKPKEVWTDLHDPTLPPDFKIVEPLRKQHPE